MTAMNALDTDLRDAILARLPRQFHELKAAAIENGWQWSWGICGPFEFGSDDRELVDFQASLRGTGHGISASFAADAPTGQPRPRFRCLRALAGCGAETRQSSLRRATEYIRANPAAS